jgi:hypothetical protein
MCKESLMIDEKNPKVSIFAFYCPKLDNMTPKSCDIIMTLKKQKALCRKMHGAFLL